ncbi:MAG: RidA family protein [Nannocystaceae bacterium]
MDSTDDTEESAPRIIQPEGWPRPRGYSNGMAARGEFLAIAGQIGWDEREQIVDDAFTPQFRKALENVVAVVRAAGGEPQHIIGLTIYVTDKRVYIDEIVQIGEAYRAVIGKHFPSMALVEVSALLEPRAKVEIQGLAVLPAKGE